VTHFSRTGFLPPAAEAKLGQAKKTSQHLICPFRRFVPFRLSGCSDDLDFFHRDQTADPSFVEVREGDFTFSSETAISIPIGRSIESRKIFAVECGWPRKSIGPRRRWRRRDAFPAPSSRSLRKAAGAASDRFPDKNPQEQGVFRKLHDDWPNETVA
jgi:hypothetical protein